MPSPRDRRTPARRPRPRPGGPGRGARDPRAGRPQARGASSRASAVPAAARRPRPRLTSRAAVLVVVVAVLVVSYASSMRAYLDQREQLTADERAIAERSANIERMEDEVRRNQTRAFREQQGRELGWVWPGETPYAVLDDGQPLDVESSLGDPAEIDPAQPPAWWEGAWDTMRVAGNPPRRTDPLPPPVVSDPEGAPTAGRSGSSEDGE